MVQIQELQDEVNSLEFFDPETASSSGLSHVPSQLVSMPSPRVLISRDSCLQPATRNSLGTTGCVFEDLPAPDGPSSALFGISKNLASASCGSVLVDTGRVAERAGVLEREHPESCNTDTTFCQEVFDLESSLSCWGNLSSKSDDWMNHRGVKFQNCIFDKFLTLRSSSVRRRISRPKYVLVQEILLTQCCGSKKCMLPHLFFFGSIDSWWSSSTQTQSSHQASQILEYILSDWLRKEMTYKISKQNGTKLY